MRNETVRPSAEKLTENLSNLYQELKQNGKLIQNEWNFDTYELNGKTYDAWYSRHGTLQEIKIGF